MKNAAKKWLLILTGLLWMASVAHAAPNCSLSFQKPVPSQGLRLLQCSERDSLLTNVVTLTKTPGGFQVQRVDSANSVIGEWTAKDADVTWTQVPGGKLVFSARAVDSKTNTPVQIEISGPGGLSEVNISSATFNLHRKPVNCTRFSGWSVDQK